jgi:hypothetical protein
LGTHIRLACPVTRRAPPSYELYLRIIIWSTRQVGPLDSAGISIVYQKIQLTTYFYMVAGWARIYGKRVISGNPSGYLIMPGNTSLLLLLDLDGWGNSKPLSIWGKALIGGKAGLQAGWLALLLLSCSIRHSAFRLLDPAFSYTQILFRQRVTFIG